MTTPSASLLEVSLAGVRLRNPVVLAAGTAGEVDEISDALPLDAIGAITTKSITREARVGNAPWRLIETRVGMLNAIGLANPGIEAFVRDRLPRAAALPCAVIASAAGHSIDDYVAVASTFDTRSEPGIIELNVSCPNTATGLQFGDDPKLLTDLLKAVRPTVIRKRLFVKLSPGAGDLVRLSQVAVEHGADGLTLCNTFPALAIDPESRRSRLARGGGGLSGPAIHPIAVRVVHDVHRLVTRGAAIPIIGLGGVMHWEDAAEFILAGATAVGMGTALFVNPRAPLAIVKGLAKWAERQGVASIQDLIGAMEPPCA
ncbi:MAG: dihydroorotate dehydrogenase [Phycisphaeraceae bacterium]|nr:dihydroorotate dehydrogenase [Phycisphaeraceae bacterium]